MKKIILVVLIGFTSCSGKSQNTDMSSNDTILQMDTISKPSVQHVNTAFDTIHRFDYTVYEKVVSKKALNILKRTLPNWRLPDPTSFEALWFNYYKKDDFLLDYIHGDFNCDTQQDYVFILENLATKELAAWVLQSDGSEHKATLLEILKRGEPHITTSLELVDRGVKIQDFDARNAVNTNKIVTLPCEAITIQYQEGTSRIYYWNKDKFERITASD